MGSFVTSSQCEVVHRVGKGCQRHGPQKLRGNGVGRNYTPSDWLLPSLQSTSASSPQRISRFTSAEKIIIITFRSHITRLPLHLTLSTFHIAVAPYYSTFSRFHNTTTPASDHPRIFRSQSHASQLPPHHGKVPPVPPPRPLSLLLTPNLNL